MKRILLAVLVFLMLLPLTACGNSNDANWKDFTVSGVTLTLNGKCADALKTLEASCTKTTPSASCWKKTGQDVVYEYQKLGFRLKTYRAEENDPDEILRGIEFLSDTAKTPEGITVGSTAETVRNTYGTPSKEEGTLLTYVKKKAELQLTVKSGKVTEIKYFAD